MRVLSYNIHKGIGGRDRKYSLERVLDVIREQDPDVVCLQEVDHNRKRSNFDDQPKLIAEALGGQESLYQMNVPQYEGGYGNLIVSRYPFRRARQFSLSFCRCKPRGAQVVVVEGPSGLCRITNWHLGLYERERSWQAYRLLEHNFFREYDWAPSLVIGDTNDWRNNLHRGPFSEYGFRKVTDPVNRFRSFPAYWPVAPLDKAFTRDIPHCEVRLIKTKLAKDASDHLPVVVEIG
ncbi:hypothetical protein V22_38210 [Calycomorphotria hydatis]|uniref:Endonuclease/exonuclease/phosphatase domain-containing protein n=1 Tax=Calycomorphotria hydatis TaxID=2528027 RepID=A0A517TDV0_9PLAN|nr:hypothetical protein V22_38210 [Calycomorphotria hydatis]